MMAVPGGSVELDAVREVDSYVWCNVRGDIHESTYSAVQVKRHGGVELYDLYDNGELCAGENHRPVYVLANQDYDEFGAPLILPRSALPAETTREDQR